MHDDEVLGDIIKLSSVNMKSMKWLKMIISRAKIESGVVYENRASASFVIPTGNTRGHPDVMIRPSLRLLPLGPVLGRGRWGSGIDLFKHSSLPIESLKHRHRSSC